MNASETGSAFNEYNVDAADREATETQEMIERLQRRNPKFPLLARCPYGYPVIIKWEDVTKSENMSIMQM